MRQIDSLDEIEMGLYAPGVDILSTIPENKYETYSGTSMATPFVAGILAVMKSIKPEITNKEAYEMLNLTVAKSNALPIVDPKLALEKLLEKK